MKETRRFLVPDYYGEFRCKIGACRHACCEGWPICISMQDYFRLLGVPVSAELRRRLDAHLHVCDAPTPEHYAQICPQYDGSCGLRLADGRCGLQVECGEEALSAVCRMYPRGVRCGTPCECSCSNSCEAVLELFMQKTSPIRFESRELTLEIPSAVPRENVFDTAGRSLSIRRYLIGILQERSLDIPRRLLTVGLALTRLQELLKEPDGAGIDRFLASAPLVFVPSGQGVREEHLSRGLALAARMVSHINEHSSRVSSFGVSALAWFASGSDILSQYRHSAAVFERLVPNWRLVMEHILVNHVFFEQFPFQDRPLDLFDECVGLCGTYSLLRFLALGWLPWHGGEHAFVDLCASISRLLEHTAFDMYACHLLKGLGCSQIDELYDLVRL